MYKRQSLGILIYEMLTGHVPFDADTSVAIALKHINELMPDVRDEMPDIPESINKIIQDVYKRQSQHRSYAARGI